MYVVVHDNEPIESALKRFKRLCERDGLFQEIRKHERYEKKSEKRNRLKRERLRKIQKFNQMREDQDKKEDLFVFTE